MIGMVRSIAEGLRFDPEPGRRPDHLPTVRLLTDNSVPGAQNERVDTDLHRREDPMPQKSWSKKDERQYEHIKESEMDRGKSEEGAEEIAARTVNKQRQQEGRTENRTPGGTGNPNTRLEDRTLQELRNRAEELDIEGRGSMDKDELVEAIRDHA
jgi:hypothetical protein